MDEQKKNYIASQLKNPNKGKMIDLSHESLSIADYEWLAEHIKKSSYVEVIKLPPVPKEDAASILAILTRATVNNSTLIAIDANFSEVIYDKDILPLYNQIQSRLQRNKNHIFGVHGGGNIGLGLMADIVSRSPNEYQVIATTNNQLIANLVNASHELGLQHGGLNSSERSRVQNIRMISRENQDIIHLYKESSIVAICVTPVVMSDIAKDIAEALIARYETDGSGLKILVLMNIPNCAEFVFKKVRAEILSITHDSLYADKLLSGIEFVPTVIDRIVTPITEKEVKNQLRRQLEGLDRQSRMLYLEATGFEEKPSIDELIDAVLLSPEKLGKAVSLLNLQFDLFFAEKKFLMYTPASFVEAYRFPRIKITENLDRIEAIKNKFINGPHAILAWTGALMGYKTIAESIKNPIIFSFIKDMMEKEIAPILTAEYPEITKEEFDTLQTVFLERCKNIDDPVTRVGRDPLRKLDRGARIRGTIELASKHHLKIATPRLEQGIAAGFLYAIKGVDQSNPGCQKIVEIYAEHNKSFNGVLCYRGPAPSGHFTGIDPHNELILINNILIHLAKLNRLYDQIHHPKTVPSSKAIILFKTDLLKASESIPKALRTTREPCFSDRSEFATPAAQNYGSNRYRWHIPQLKKNNETEATADSSATSQERLSK